MKEIRKTRKANLWETRMNSIKGRSKEIRKAKTDWLEVHVFANILIRNIIFYNRYYIYNRRIEKTSKNK